MTLLKRLMPVLALAAAMAVAGCSQPTYFRQPLSPPGQAQYDERLIGSWVARSEEDGLLVLVIAPSEAEGEAGILTISATMTGIDPDGKPGAVIGWFRRVAHASRIDGETYYNIRAAAPGSSFAILDEAGTRIPEPEETDWFNTPDHAMRDYWIAKPEFTEDGMLRLGFIEVNDWDLGADAGDALKRRLWLQGQGASAWTEGCGGGCTYSRADLRPEELAEIIRSFPKDEVFNLVAGPLTRLRAALPKFDYDLP